MRGRKPDERKARAVQLLYEVGYTITELASYFSVTKRHIRRMIGGK